MNLATDRARKKNNLKLSKYIILIKLINVKNISIFES